MSRQCFWVVLVSPVEYYRCLHEGLHSLKIRFPERQPLCNQNKSVYTIKDFVLVLSELHVRVIGKQRERRLYGLWIKNMANSPFLVRA